MVRILGSACSKQLVGLFDQPQTTKFGFLFLRVVFFLRLVIGSSREDLIDCDL
jgi:hypothetical protein